MNISFLKKMCLSASVSGCLVCASCTTDYRAAAVEDARTYALKHTRELTEVQRDFIRYTDPVIMEQTIFTSKQPSMPQLYTVRSRMDKRKITSRENDFVHSCIVWNPPDMSGKSVVVDGSGERSMRRWTPGRLIIKYYEPVGENQTASINTAVSFVAGRLPEISAEDMNAVRFSTPEIRMTAFDLQDTLPSGEAESAETEEDREKSLWQRYLGGKKPEKETVCQISVSWVSPKTKERIIVCGNAPGKSMKGWTPKKVFFRSENEYRQFVKGRVPKTTGK